MINQPGRWPRLAAISQTNMEAQTKINFDKQATTLKMLADANRLRIIHTLSRMKEATVTQLIAETGMEQSHLSHNLTKMKDRGVLQSRRDGKQMLYSMTDVVDYKSQTGEYMTINL